MDTIKNNLKPFEDLLAVRSWNPNVAEDLKKYVFKDSDIDELRTKLDKLASRNSEEYSAVVRYLDIVELIHHMRVVSEEVTIQGEVFHGEELKGFIFDIDALNFYLTLSAIDVVNAKQFEPLDDWIKKEENLKGFEKYTDLKSFLTDKITEYKKQYGMNQTVKKVYTDMDYEFKAKMVKNTTLIKVSSFEEIRSKLEENELSDDIDTCYKKIMKFVYDFRNKYTHSMIKVSKPPKSVNASIIIFNSDDAMKLTNKSNSESIQVLVVNKGYDLEEALLEISANHCRTYFK